VIVPEMLVLVQLWVFTVVTVYLEVPVAAGVPFMVHVGVLHDAVTPAGRPLAVTLEAFWVVNCIEEIAVPSIMAWIGLPLPETGVMVGLA
jgi:hypothetical protein